jgi:hypothetical protein
MRVLFAALLACAVGLMVSCESRKYNKDNNPQPVKTEEPSGTPQDQDGTQNKIPVGTNPGDSAPDDTTPGGSVRGVQVNPKAFNALSLWRDDRGYDIVRYPYDYNVEDGEQTPDGVFYVESADYYKSDLAGRKFIAVPTEGAKVVGDALEYPVKNSRQLKLKFTSQSPSMMKHAEAREYCDKQGLRLPTVRELFDFCASGVTEPNYGRYFQPNSYPKTAACGSQRNWSASVVSSQREYAWYFDYYNGTVAIGSRGNADRYNTQYVRCVGAP